MDNHPLDNPVWSSLSESHQAFSIELEGVKFYQPDIAPFGGFIDIENTANGLAQYAEFSDEFFILGERPNCAYPAVFNSELVCEQMVIDRRINIQGSDQIVQIGREDSTALFDLVNMVQPGYFKQRTSVLGNYYGIYKEGILVAVTGERMNMNAYTEVSAVVTDPEHTGKGYAKILVSHVVDKILSEGKMPFLHVAESNELAIILYKKLGFVTRRKISLWRYKKLVD